jgi:hypothetical protein
MSHGEGIHKDLFHAPHLKINNHGADKSDKIALVRPAVASQPRQAKTGA